MKPRSFDPRRLDLPRFSAAGAALSGSWGADALPRLVADAPLADGGAVPWVAEGQRRAGAGGAAVQDWLHLKARAEVVLTCQRCLQPLVEALTVDRWLRFVADEAEAERLDEASEEDVLALPARGGVDLGTLVEDELILTLPLVPRHAHCDGPAVVGRGSGAAEPVDPADPSDANHPAAEDSPTRQAPHPFAALASLRGRRGGGAGQ